jgi:hypothetical protein
MAMAAMNMEFAGGRLCTSQENRHFWVPTIEVRPPDGNSPKEATDLARRGPKLEAFTVHLKKASRFTFDRFTSIRVYQSSVSSIRAKEVGRFMFKVVALFITFAEEFGLDIQVRAVTKKSRYFGC